jgi:hypothetical protein
VPGGERTWRVRWLWKLAVGGCGREGVVRVGCVQFESSSRAGRRLRASVWLSGLWTPWLARVIWLCQHSIAVTTER